MSEVIDTSPSNVDSSCASSNPGFLMIYSAYRLNKQGDNIHSWCTPFTIWNQSVPSLFLTVSSWPSYRFIMRQVRWSGIPVSWRIFHSFFQIYTVKGFGVINKEKVYVFLEFSCFSMIEQMLAIWSLVPLPFLNLAWTSGSSWFMYRWSLSQRILSITLLVC